MSDLSNKFIYEERNIDKDLVEAACKWNTTKADRAHLIYLNSKPKHGNTSLLRHLEQDLSYRGFRALFIDPKQNNSIYAPCSLAAALHNALSDNRLHVLKQGIYELLHGSIGVMFSRLMLIIIWLVTFIIYKYSGDASFSSPYIHNFFYNFLSVKNIMKLVVEFFGWTTALIIILNMVFRTQPFFDEKAAKEFAETGAYFRKIAKFGRGRTVALLIDNAKDIDLATEINIINHLLNSDTEYDSRIGLPKDFRILIVTLGQLPGLRLGGKSPEEFKIPKLSATIERDCTAIAMRVRQKIDEFLTTAKFKRRTGRMGTHEWMAYEAELDRPTITRQELQALYAEVIRSDIMPLLGLKGPHPSKPPATILRENRPFPFKMDFGSVYFSEARKFFSEHHIDLVAKARLMLAIPGICRIRSGEQWRDWGPEAHREVLYAADHAKDLSDSDVTGQDVFTLLQGDNNRRLKVIIELMDLLVTAAEIQKARGQLVKAVAYLYSAGNWFGTVEQTIPESLQSRFLYELWTNFWFSCEVEHRTWIHDFETKHPRVKESNTWKILTNYERRLQGQPLAEDVSDPGMINPELSNIFQLTKLAELLIKIYGDDIDEAAISETVDIGIVYQELYPTYFGILLAGIQCNLLYRRGEVCSALEQIKKKIAGQYDNIRSDWMGYRLIIDFRLAVDKVVDLWWHRSSVDPAKLIGMQDELLARVIELRDLAVLIGFRLINMEASYNLAWINQMRIQYEPPLNEDDIKLVPIIERYFQLVLNHEKGLGWVNRTPKIFGHRIFLLENTDKDPIVDDQVGLYHAAKQAGYPLKMQVELLEKALIAVANHGNTEKHTLQTAILSEQAAELTENGKREQSFWRMEYLEEEVVIKLSLAANARCCLGEFGAAAELLDRAERLLDKARAIRPGNDTVREGWIDIWAQRALIARKLGEEQAEKAFFELCWSNMRAIDNSAPYIFNLFINGKSETSRLSEDWPRKALGDFKRDSTCDDFVPSKKTLSLCGSKINRFEWRLLQFQAGSEGLRQANEESFYKAILSLGGLARSVPVNKYCKDILIGLLDEAERHYAGEGASNKKQRECIALITHFDPSRDSEMKLRLATIDNEDVVLTEREKIIESIIMNSERQEDFVIIDSALRNPQTGSTDDAYISECIETTKKAADMLSNSEYREAVLLLKDHIDQIIPNRILLVELRMFQLFLFALRSSTSTSKDYHHKEVQFRELRHAFLIQLFPHRESNSLEQLDAVLIEGLIKINPPIAGTQI